ncbi:hypothetical protein KP509_24G004900 [Ceratopteris richardii]|nr:hypothetical protein KP509_24G004900 [Ceratopteris richardii]
MGLNPQRHLGKNLAEMYPCLNQLHVRFGINVCGEGGEYETLTLDCPLFKNHRILLDEYEIVQHSADNIAPVGVLHPSKFHLECKDLQSFQPTPELCIKDVVTDMEKVLVCKNEDINVSLDFHEPVTRSKHGISFTSCSRESGDLAIYSSWTGSCKNNFGINEELGFVLDSIQEELEKTELSWGDVLYIHLYIDSMEAFASANEMYMQIITENACTNGVPSRSTVGVDLLESDSGRVLVEVIAAKKTKKKVLHVKSISCWAPNCIGPYSQATLSRGLLYMAGQLGLDPPTMRLVSGGPALEMEQALKNCEAVAEVFSTSTVNSSISILVYWSASIGILERQEAQASLSTFLSCDCSSSPDRAPVVHVQVRALPKGAAIEVEPFLYAPSCEESFNPSANLKRFRKGVHCEGTLIPGQLLRAFFSLPFNILVNNVNSASMVSAVDISSLASICTELKVCLQSFSDLLAEASFTWENVLALRILFASRAISRELILAAWNQATCYGPDSSTKNFSMECSISGVQSIQPLFVPVLCSGMDLNMNGLATLDLLALR